MDLLFKASARTTFNKREFLFTPGSTSNEVFFITKGLVRAFTINEKLEEITIALYPENSFVVNVDQFLFDEASNYYYEAYEKTKTLSIDYCIANKIVDNHPILAKNKQQVFRKFLRSMFRRIESFVLYSPEERYIRYTEMFPYITNRVPDKYIANILGITPVSLSRIRKRLITK